MSLVDSEYSALRCGEHAAQLCVHEREISAMRQAVKELERARWVQIGAMAMASGAFALAGSLIGIYLKVH